MKIILSSAAVAGLFAAGAATAGGFVAPVVDVEPVVAPAPVGDWQGAYVGATLGYAFDGKDRFGYHDNASPNTYYGFSDTFKMDGALGGVRAGYRWQTGKWVYAARKSRSRVARSRTISTPAFPAA